MKNRHGLFIAIGLVIGLSLLTVGIYWLNSPTYTDSVTYNLPATSLSPDYFSSISPKTPYCDGSMEWFGYLDGYYGDPVDMPDFVSLLDIPGNYEQVENLKEAYYEGYLTGLNDRIEELESSQDD